jgi:peptidoglycan/xylan/chitin deacetylase (PgdA/CDA1 family)
VTTVTLYHDIEQDVNVEAEIEGCRDALRRLLAIEAKHGIHTTYNIVGALWKAQPELVEWIRAGGHEVAFHSYHHRLECPADEFSEEVRLCRLHSSDPQGYRSPRSRWSEDTLRSCWEHGFAWNAESDPAHDPYVIYEGLVRLPIAGDDWPIHTGAINTDEWIDRYRLHLQERNYVAVGVHDCVVSHRADEMIAAWDRCLEIASEERARIVPFGEAAQAFVTGTR